MKSRYVLWFYGWRDVPFVCSSEFLFLVAWQMISNKRLVPHRILLHVSNKCVKLIMPDGATFTDGNRQFAKVRIPASAVALSTVGPFPRDSVIAVLVIPIKNVSENSGVLVFRCDSAEAAAAVQYSLQKMIRHHHDSSKFPMFSLFRHRDWKRSSSRFVECSSICPFLGHQYSYVPQPGSGALSAADRCLDPISYWRRLMQHQAVISELKSRFSRRRREGRLQLDNDNGLQPVSHDAEVEELREPVESGDTSKLLRPSATASGQPVVRTLRRSPSNNGLAKPKPLPHRLFGETVRWRCPSPMSAFRPMSADEDSIHLLHGSGNTSLSKCRSVDVFYEHF